MEFRPLSSRGKPNARFDGPQHGLPDYLLEPVRRWAEPLLRERRTGPVSEATLQTLQSALRMQRPLVWDHGALATLQSLFSRMADDRDFALDVLDFLVPYGSTSEEAEELDTTLAVGGSEWEVAEVGEDHRQLAKRTIGPVREGIDAVRSHSQRAHAHLMSAWTQLTGRQPNPSAAYQEAIKAVEAVAGPVVSPFNDRATLGTVIRDIRAKPSKWEVTLDSATSENVADLADLIWKGQADRHGSHDESIPLVVSQQEADAAVHLAIPLVRLFAGGHFRPV